MYDPARDIFTSSDDALPHPDDEPKWEDGSKGHALELQEPSIKSDDHKDHVLRERAQRSSLADVS